MNILEQFSRCSVFFLLHQSLHRTPTIPTSNSMVSSVTSNGLTLSMNFNNIKTEKSSYDNLTHSIPQFFNQISHPHLLDDGYDNISIATNSPLDSSGTFILYFSTNSFTFLSEQVVQPKRWQSIHLIFPFTLQMTTNQINHQRKNSSKYTFTHQQTSPSSTTNILRHISTPSLELYPNHAQAETMN